MRQDGVERGDRDILDARVVRQQFPQRRRWNIDWHGFYWPGGVLLLSVRRGCVASFGKLRTLILIAVAKLALIQFVFIGRRLLSRRAGWLEPDTHTRLTRAHIPAAPARLLQDGDIYLVAVASQPHKGL